MCFFVYLHKVVSRWIIINLTNGTEAINILSVYEPLENLWAILSKIRSFFKSGLTKKNQQKFNTFKKPLSDEIKNEKYHFRKIKSDGFKKTNESYS